MAKFRSSEGSPKPEGNESDDQLGTAWTAAHKSGHKLTLLRPWNHPAEASNSSGIAHDPFETYAAAKSQRRPFLARSEEIVIKGVVGCIDEQRAIEEGGQNDLRRQDFLVQQICSVQRPISSEETELGVGTIESARTSLHSNQVFRLGMLTL